MAAGAVSLRPESFVVPAICKLLLASNGDLRQAAESAPYVGVGARTVQVIRALVDAGSTSGWDEIAPYKIAVTSFVESLRNQSAFFALADSFFPMPLRSNSTRPFCRIANVALRRDLSSNCGRASWSRSIVKPLRRLLSTFVIAV